MAVLKMRRPKNPEAANTKNPDEKDKGGFAEQTWS
jgi:hypothetical protein